MGKTSRGGPNKLSGTKVNGQAIGKGRSEEHTRSECCVVTAFNQSADSSTNLLWEVYTCYRPLQEVPGDLFTRLPSKLKDQLRDLGVCHFMTVFKSPTGDLIQFDFGPRGGDIVLDMPKRMTAEKRARAAEDDKIVQILMKGKAKKIYAGPRGEIREELLEALPAQARLVGRAPLTLATIHSFNASHNLTYKLNQNDCRHYVDTLVKHTTGLDRASAYLMRQAIRQRLCDPDPSRTRYYLATLAQMALEKENTAKIALAAQLSIMATAAAGAARLGLSPFLGSTGLVSFQAASLGVAGAILSQRPGVLPLVKEAAIRAVETVGRSSTLAGKDSADSSLLTTIDGLCNDSKSATNGGAWASATRRLRIIASHAQHFSGAGRKVSQMSRHLVQQCGTHVRKVVQRGAKIQRQIGVSMVTIPVYREKSSDLLILSLLRPI